MAYKFYKITPEGKEAVKEFLLEHHKRPEEATTEAALARWVQDAEMYAELNDDQVLVEIPAEDTHDGEGIALALGDDFLEVTAVNEAC